MEAQILSAEKFRDSLGGELRNAQSQVLLISAFITAPALDWIKENTCPDLSVTLVARWDYKDMALGSSDFLSYWKARDFGFKFFVDSTLHTKAYIIDRTNVFLGSANLTSRGLWLYGAGNEERSTMLTPPIDDIESLELLVRQAIELNDELVHEMEKVVSGFTPKNENWPDDILIKLIKPIRSLWVADLLFCSPEKLLSGDCSSSAREQDAVTLSIADNILSRSKLQILFKQTKIFLWLRELIKQEGDLRFGCLSEALHQALLDSPKPYRREVKEFVKSLFSWVEFLQDESITIKKHRHTVSMKWVEK